MMQPIHSLEYELTSKVQRMLVRWELRRSWRRDFPVFVCSLCFAVLIVWLGLQGWMLPVVGGGLLCLVMLFVIGAIYRRWALAYTVAMTALLALRSNDRRVRVEFTAEDVSMETESVRGKGA